MFSLSPTPLALLAVIVLDSKPVFNLSPRQVGRSSVLPLRRPASIQSVWIFYQQAGKETRERASKDPVLDVSLTGHRTADVGEGFDCGQGRTLLFYHKS